VVVRRPTGLGPRRWSARSPPRCRAPAVPPDAGVRVVSVSGLPPLVSVSTRLSASVARLTRRGETVAPIRGCSRRPPHSGIRLPPNFTRPLQQPGWVLSSRSVIRCLVAHCHFRNSTHIADSSLEVPPFGTPNSQRDPLSNSNWRSGRPASAGPVATMRTDASATESRSDSADEDAGSRNGRDTEVSPAPPTTNRCIGRNASLAYASHRTPARARREVL
jgi:hypothetical protein